LQIEVVGTYTGLWKLCYDTIEIVTFIIHSSSLFTPITMNVKYSNEQYQ